VSKIQSPTPRDRLLDAAAQLFYEKGIGQVGVDLVSHTAGVSKRTLYQQFGSKDQLIADCLIAHGPGVMEQYIQCDDSALSSRERIITVFGRLGSLSSADGFRGCPFINTAAELADPNHPARQVARDFKLRLRAYFLQQAEAGGAGDAECLADQLVIIFDGAILQAVMDLSTCEDAATRAVTTLLDAHGVSADQPPAD
jgi:AcrR family transcriptional regulator